MGLRPNPGPGSLPELLLFQPNTWVRTGAVGRKMAGGMARGVLISRQGLCAGGWVGTRRWRGLGMLQSIAAVGGVTFVLAFGGVRPDGRPPRPTGASAQRARRGAEF